MKQDHIFLSVKVSSITLTKAEILDIAIVRTTRKAEILETYSDKVQPTKSVDAECGKALRYSESDWANAVPLKDALFNIRSKILEHTYDEKYIVIAHFGSDLARPVLNNACSSVSESPLFEGRGWLDTAQIAWPLIFDDVVTSRSLKALARYCGVEIKDEHTATGEVAILMQCYWVLMRRFTAGIFAEEKLRATKAGPALETVQKIFRGF